MSLYTHIHESHDSLEDFMIFFFFELLFFQGCNECTSYVLNDLKNGAEL